MSILCAILITICSIAQFHHHSNDGRMIVYTCIQNNSCNQEHNHKNDQHSTYSSTCSHDCHDSHQHDEKNCSLKINILKLEKKQIQKIIVACIVIADNIFNNSNTLHTIYINPDVNISYPEANTSIGLRSPPIM